MGNDRGLSYVDFRNPPLVEVVTGVMFPAIETLLAPHTGLFWSNLKDQLPNAYQANRYVSGTDYDYSGPMPRVWLTSVDETRLLQIQENLFFYNWRHRRRDSLYPRYATIEAEFFDFLEKFENFLSENDIGEIHSYRPHLAYINHIERGAGWNNIEDVSNVFPFLSWSRLDVLGNPKGFQWRASFPNEAGQIDVYIARGERDTDQKELFSFELRATTEMVFDSKPAVTEWLREAHRLITQGFVELTEKEIQTSSWERE